MQNVGLAINQTLKGLGAQQAALGLLSIVLETVSRWPLAYFFLERLEELGGRHGE